MDLTLRRMGKSMGGLLAKLWRDDCGALIASEYLMLGSILTLGGVAGLASLRDATNNEMHEFANSVHNVTQSYQVKPMQSRQASRAGSNAVDLSRFQTLNVAP